MRDELKQVIKEVRRNEAVIEYLYLRGELPQSFRSISEVTKGIMASTSAQEVNHDYSSAQ